MDITSIILLLGTIQGFILTIVLYRWKHNREANRLLSISIGLISLALFNAYLTTIFDYQEYTFLIKVGDPLVFFFLPFLYLYVKRLTGSVDSGRFKTVAYFIPGILYIVANLPFYFSSKATKLAYFDRLYINNIMNNYDFAEEIFASLVGLYFSINIVLTVLRYRHRIKNEFSDVTGITLEWLLIVSITTLVLVAIGAVVAAVRLFGLDVPPAIGYLTALGSSIFIYVIGYFAMSQPDIFLAETFYEVKPETIVDKNYKDYLERIRNKLAEQELYKNASLTLTELSIEVKLPSYLISKTINNELNENFHTFINRYRIEQVKEALASPDHRDTSIISLAYSYGYSSKSTFNLAFKKFTGKTPTNYREQVLGEISKTA